MIFPPFWRKQTPGTISALYGAIVAQARSPSFYRIYRVPDTLDGRFELLLLHLFLILRRLGDGPGRTLGQQIFDLFCQDMDRNLREIGISDLKVPKEMRRIGEAYYGRAKAYEAAWTSDGAALMAAISRNVYGSDDPEPAGAGRLASYMMEAAARLSDQDDTSFFRGAVRFPEPR